VGEGGKVVELFVGVGRQHGYTLRSHNSQKTRNKKTREERKDHKQGGEEREAEEGWKENFRIRRK